MDFEMIPPGELDRYVGDANALIVDLREPEEYRRRHIKGAVNLPYSRLDGRNFFPKNKILVLYCERGASSLSAAKMLARGGFQVKTVVGGIHAYRGNLTEMY